MIKCYPKYLSQKMVLVKCTISTSSQNIIVKRWSKLVNFNIEFISRQQWFGGLAWTAQDRRGRSQAGVQELFRFFRFCNDWQRLRGNRLRPGLRRAAKTHQVVLLLFNPLLTTLNWVHLSLWPHCQTIFLHTLHCTLHNPLHYCASFLCLCLLLLATQSNICFQIEFFYAAPFRVVRPYMQ